MGCRCVGERRSVGGERGDVGVPVGFAMRFAMGVPVGATCECVWGGGILVERRVCVVCVVCGFCGVGGFGGVEIVAGVCIGRCIGVCSEIDVS